MEEAMYKAVIVDDEKYIRKSIRNRVNWEQYGVSVEAEAGNGAEALKVLEQIHADIILVDIRMPVMDGLAFIAEAKRRKLRLNYIIMSAYSDFSYAQKAIKLGVEDYILKPVDEEELGEILRKIVHKKNEELLSTQVRHMDFWLGENIPFPGGEMLALAFYVEANENAEHLVEAAVSHEVSSLPGQAAFYYLRDYSRNDCFVYLINGNVLQEETEKELAERVWDRLAGLGGASACSSVRPVHEAGTAAKESVSRLKRKIFCPEKKVIPEFLYEKQATSVQRKNMQDRLLHIYRQMLKHEYEKVKAELEDVSALIIKREFSMEFIEEYIGEVLNMLRHIPGGQDSSTDFNIMFCKFRSKDYLLEFKTADELKANLSRLAALRLDTICNEGNKDVIMSIKAYIRSNYAADLNAAQIAQKFYLNASYLSTLFKEKTGMNLTSYIEGIRMEKAKQLLEGKALSITEVALDTGYSDSNYFSKVFKKYTGMPPRQYRENAQRDSR